MCVQVSFTVAANGRARPRLYLILLMCYKKALFMLFMEHKCIFFLLFNANMCINKKHCCTLFLNTTILYQFQASCFEVTKEIQVKVTLKNTEI